MAPKEISSMMLDLNLDLLFLLLDLLNLIQRTSFESLENDQYFFTPFSFCKPRLGKSSLLSYMELETDDCTPFNKDFTKYSDKKEILSFIETNKFSKTYVSANMILDKINPSFNVSSSRNSEWIRIDKSFVKKEKYREIGKIGKIYKNQTNKRSLKNRHFC